MKSIVFCKISSMKYYKGAGRHDQPFNGGSFVKEKIKPEMVNTLITKYPMLVKFSNAVEPYVTLRIKENENIIEKAKEFLNTVIEI